MREDIEIFKSLFKGREDVFAIRWEKDGKSGYTPAYDFNWEEFRLHKANGGTLKTFSNKTYAALTGNRILNHLTGKEVLGIYPLLLDNSTWFIAADFDSTAGDDQSWKAECRRFLKICKQYQLPVYLERSRSGAGGHIWMFFENACPAAKSRRIFLSLLDLSGVISEKNTTFDRLFPNQDYHSGKELGNLIALPLQKLALQNQNSCFLHPETFEPYKQQVEFLKTIERVSLNSLDELFNKIVANNHNAYKSDVQTIVSADKLYIILDNQIFISKKGLPNILHRYLRDALNFINPEYFIKKNTGRNPYGTEKYFINISDGDDHLSLPRGFIANLIRYCREQSLAFNLEDKRVKLESVEYEFTAALLPFQQEAVEVAEKKDFGVIVSPPGSGKTVMALSIVARKKQAALIIVHRKQIFDQWIERIQAFLGIPAFQIGKIDGSGYNTGHMITIAMVQSLNSDSIPKELYRSFGTIIIDECHHIPAKTFCDAIGRFYSYYIYGFTATPFRKSEDQKKIFIHIGEILHTAVVPLHQKGNRQFSIIIKTTDFFLPFNSTTDNVDTLLDVLVHDTTRNEVLVEDAKREAKAGRKVLVLTERRLHVEILFQYLKQSCEVITLTGDDKEESRKFKQAQIEDGNFQILIATGQLIGEGTDFGILDCLILAFPFSFHGKLVQYIGRVQRSSSAPILYDYNDAGIDYLSNQFKERNKYYRKLLADGKLVKFDELVLVFKGTEFYINEANELLSISCLDIPFGIEKFKPDISWRIRVINYNEETGDLFSEILEYNFPLSESRNMLQGEFYFYGIEKIRFKNIDTNGLLKSVEFKKINHSAYPVAISSLKDTKNNSERVFIRKMKVPLSKINFLFGAVSFPIFIDAFEKEMLFTIENVCIRPEFSAIREYFSKAFNKKLIDVDVSIRYDDQEVLQINATSKEIDAINNSMIESVRFQFVKREILRRTNTGQKQMNTIEDMFIANQEARQIFQTDKELVNDILGIKKTKHYHHLKYLAAKHVAHVLKMRFVLQPFSFLFLLGGENKYHVIWETLDTEEATYVWHSLKSREALKISIAQIETDLSAIKQNGRQSFLDTNPANFSRIVHDYSKPEQGFMIWKGQLDQAVD